MNRIIEDFSYLRKTNCKGVYLDNAATTLCPDEVIDYMSEMQKYNFVNINRGSYKLAEETFEKYELAKKKILHFFGAENDYLFIQTTGATEAINIFVEEIIFRKNIYTFIQNIAGVKCAVVFSALIFALYHCDIVIFLNMEFSQILAEIPLFFMGLGLAYTQEKTADIVCPVLVHMIINVISLS